jgi:hypothetical protein
LSCCAIGAIASRAEAAPGIANAANTANPIRVTLFIDHSSHRVIAI